MPLTMAAKKKRNKLRQWRNHHNQFSCKRCHGKVDGKHHFYCDKCWRMNKAERNLKEKLNKEGDYK